MVLFHTLSKTIPLNPKIERKNTMNENSIPAAESAQNVNAETTAKASIGKRIWSGTKKAAESAACVVLTVGYVAINVAVVALPLAACVKYLRED